MPQRYLLDDYLADTNSGHNVVSTIFIECGTNFDTDGPAAFRPVGETQFAIGVAAMSESGRYGKTRVAAGIVGTAYLSDGDNVAGVLDAQLDTGGQRFKGIRQAAAHDDDPSVPNHRTNPPRDLYANGTFREGFAHLAPRNLSFEAWCYHPQIPGLTELARTFPDTTIILEHFGGPLGVGRYAGRDDEIFNDWREAILPLSRCPNVFSKLGASPWKLTALDGIPIIAPREAGSCSMLPVTISITPSRSLAQSDACLSRIFQSTALVPAITYFGTRSRI